MKCPKCQYDNPEDTNFCGKCAAPLAASQTKTPADLEKTIDKTSLDLAAGTLIAGKYRILAKLGSGGMGEVYRAEDISLSRQVAIKVLPDIFAADPERLARFEREARVLASLNHPNIAAIYGVEEADGKRFLILELVEGETLAERLDKGPLSREETLDVCRQIAEGLEAAHEKAIIHRDLKPANVKINLEGKVKILDFGLARAIREQSSEVDIINSPTITAGMTQPGVILGTAAYMSPEQAKGKAVDKRADIWAFGCILYECLTGKRAFPGDTATESIAAILRGEPDWGELPAGTPGNVRAVLYRCLQKDLSRRLRDIGDARLELEMPTAYPSEAGPAPSEAGPAPRRFSLVWLAACITLALLVGILIGPAVTRYFRPTPSLPIIKSTIKVEPGYWLDSFAMEMRRPSRTAMAISSDGKFFVFCSIEENPGPQAEPRLYLRRLDRSEAQPIAGTEGGWSPFLSPDNRWIGFFAKGKLRKIPIEGGVPTSLCDASMPLGASWGPDGSVVFSDGTASGLSRVSADGGTPQTLTKPDPKNEESGHRLPFWLPNGKAVLFGMIRYDFDTQPCLALLNLDTRERHILLPDAADARYIRTGHLVFLRQGTLMAARFDPDRLEVIGQPVALVENVMQAFSTNGFTNTGAGQFAVSDSGILIYAPGGVVPDQKNTLVWVDQKGIEQPAASLECPFSRPCLSPDGQRIAYSTVGREYRIWVYDMSRGTNSPLTTEGWATFPVWTPDSRRLVFSWMKSGVPNLFWQPFDGSSPMERLTTGEYIQFPASWSPDGKRIAFLDGHAGMASDIAVLDVGSGRAAPLPNSPLNSGSAEISPDGRWIAYTSPVSEREEVFVRPFPGSGMKYQVSSEGGRQPLWARNGRQLFYRWENQVWAVDVRTDAGFAAGRPRLLFEKPGYKLGNPGRSYDLSPDGQRFLMVKLEQRKPAPVTEMTLVQNWFEELKRLLPAGRK